MFLFIIYIIQFTILFIIGIFFGVNFFIINFFLKFIMLIEPVVLLTVLKLFMFFHKVGKHRTKVQTFSCNDKLYKQLKVYILKN